MTDAAVTKIAQAVADAAQTGATLRIGKVTEVVGTKVRLDITGSALVAVDADVRGLAAGQRVYAMQQGPVTVVSGRLTGTQPPAVPVGTLTLYTGTSTTIPDGYLLALGASLLRSEWPALFAVIGTTYGAADAERFSLPNLQDRVVLGASPVVGARPRNATGGVERVTLNVGQIPAHTHGSVGAHSHTVEGGIGDVAGLAGGGANTAASHIGGSTGDAGGHTHSSVGSDQSHENMQPWIALYYIIRAT